MRTRQIPHHAPQFGTPRALRRSLAITVMLTFLMPSPSPKEWAAINQEPLPGLRVAAVDGWMQYGTSGDDWGAPE